VKLAGSRLGPYEIQSSIGAGGMGEVYRARDTRLDRLVAVKVIAGAAAFDPDFRERFDREARAISALDHPHICTLFDVGHEAGVDFLVMQLLEGHTLAERIARGARPSSDPSTASGSVSASTTSKGPVGIDQALRYGAEIAHALDAAHKRGIVHRDLKPGNIFVTKSGTKLLDFGLAKLAAQPAAAGLEDFPTRTVPLTGTGSIVGTLNYMAPEQLEGGPIDTRTDIFAFGAVLFEMVTGRRAFEAQSHAGLIAAILNQQPPALTDLSDTTRVLPASAHRALDRLIRKCLAKDPDDRWQSAADLAAELRWIDEERLRLAGQTEPEIVLLGGQPVSKRRERMWMATAAVALLAVAVTAAWALRPGPPEFPLRFAIPGDDLAAGVALTAVSPDGRHVAVVTGRAKGDMLTIRSMDSEELRVLAGTEGAWQPVWSPDSRSLVFGNSRNVGGQLKRVSVDGGPVMTVAHAVRGRPSWGSSDVILFSQEGTLFTVRANGGPVTPATQLDAAADEIGHAWPQFLPDGRRFLYLANHNDRTKNAIYLGTLGSPERTRIIAANSSFELSRGHLLFQRDGTVFAQRFDTDKGTAVGDPQPIVEGVAFNTANGRTTVSASANSDVLAYRLGGAALAGRTILQWVDLQGKPISMLGDGSWTSRGPAVSRDGLRVAIARLEEDGTTDLYVIDAERNVPTRLTATIGNDLSPVWSPDGAWIYFTSLRNNTNDIYRRAASGSGVDELVYPAKEPVTPTAISPDGEILLFTRGMGRETARDIWGMRLKGDRWMFQVVSTKFDDEAARFSPDGKWIAYQSDDVDERQVYAEPYPPTGDRVRLSPTSGVNPVWSADSRTVYYVDDRTKVMAVDVRAEGKTLHPSSPRELFTVNNLLPGASSLVADPRQPRFLTLVTPEERTPQPIKVIRNWQAALLK
jgi:serine/threonine protein kinase/Tol biopolymer transport system component